MQALATRLQAPLQPGEDRHIAFHDGSENTPLMLAEATEMGRMLRQEWVARGSALRRAGSFVASDQLFIEPLQPIMQADGTTITGTTEASLWPIQFSSLAGSFLHKAAQHLEFCAWGVATTPGATPGTATVTPRLGTTTGGAALGPSAASATLTISKTNVPWYCTGNFELRQVLAGANSTGCAGGDFCCDQVGIPGLCFGGTVLTTIDVTAAQGLWIGLTLGAAGDTMTTRGLIIKNVS